MVDTKIPTVGELLSGIDVNHLTPDQRLLLAPIIQRQEELSQQQGQTSTAVEQGAARVLQEQRAREFTKAITELDPNLIADEEGKKRIKKLQKGLNEGDGIAKEIISEFVGSKFYEQRRAALEAGKDSGGAFNRLQTVSGGKINPAFSECLGAISEEVRIRDFKPSISGDPAQTTRDMVDTMRGAAVMFGGRAPFLSALLLKYDALKGIARLASGVTRKEIDVDQHIGQLLDSGTRADAVETITEYTKKGHGNFLKVAGDINPKLEKLFGKVEESLGGMLGIVNGVVPDGVKESLAKAGDKLNIPVLAGAAKGRSI